MAVWMSVIGRSKYSCSKLHLIVHIALSGYTALHLSMVNCTLTPFDLGSSNSLFLNSLPWSQYMIIGMALSVLIMCMIALCTVFACLSLNNHTIT